MLLTSQWLYYITGEPKGLEDPYGNPSPYFRHHFHLDKKPVKAILSITALGVYKVYINSQPVSNDYLSPGWTEYRKNIALITYDVTHLLKVDNGIGVVLGDGWAVGHLGSNITFKRTGYMDKPMFTAQLEITFEDGSTQLIQTDENWKATQGAIRRSDIYMGEYIDTRLDLGDFSAADYDDSSWDQAQPDPFRFPRNAYLQKAINPPTVVKHILQPQLLKQEGNCYYYDLSQNISGVLRCVFKGEQGTQIVIRHAELMVDGKLYTENLRKAEATDTFILSGTGAEEFRPLFTFHGFRYATITINGQATIESVIAECMYTDLKSTGSFECSDPVVTKVYQNALWSQRDNFVNVPTDCPQRDERLGWTADAQVFCKSAMFNMDCSVFYKKYMQDVRDVQFGNGVVPVVAPLPHIGFYDYHGRGCAAGWAEAVAEIPYFHYQMYADKTVIRDNLFAIKRLLDFYQTESPEHIRRINYGYGDWLNCDADMDMPAVNTLFYARAAYDAWKLAEVLQDFEAARYRQLYEDVKAAFRKEFMDETGKITSDTQSCYLIAYSFGIITAQEAKPHLIRKLQEDDGHLTSGFLGIKFLLPTLCQLGLQDDAYRILCSREYPGWGYSVMNGATTIWEHWDSYTEEKGILPGMNSFNHYSLGSCVEWMYEYCLGIRSDFENPGFSKLTLQPYMDRTGKITWAKGHYDTRYGTVEVDWKVEKGVYTYTATVPEAIDLAFDFGDLHILEQTHTGNTHRFTLSP